MTRYLDKLELKFKETAVCVYIVLNFVKNLKAIQYNVYRVFTILPVNKSMFHQRLPKITENE